MLNEILTGSKIFFQGIKLFYGNCRYWHYAIIPMLIIVLLYCLGIWTYFEYLNPWLLSFLPDLAAYNAWLKILIYPLRWLTATAAFLVGFSILLLAVTTVYSIFSSPFFDCMAAKLESREFNFNYQEPRGWQFFVSTTHSVYDGAILNLITIFWTLLLLPLSMFVPIVGPILYILVVGYYFGLPFLVYSAEHRRIRRKELKHNLRGNRLKVLGFGLTAYILSLIPLAMIPILPAAAAGGTILFNNYLCPRKKSSGSTDLKSVVNDESSINAQ